MHDMNYNTECPVCDGPAVGRTWEVLETGVLNLYRNLICTACGHFEGDQSDGDDDECALVVIEGVEMKPTSLAHKLEFVLDTAGLLLEWCIGARAHMALIEFVSPEVGAHHQEMARILARKSGELCDATGRDMPPMLAKDRFLALAWEHGVLYPRKKSELNHPRPAFN
ncbi:TPA: hypothetical protein ACIRVE_005379 [Pseudomonas putida]